MVGVPGRSKGCHNCRQRRVKCDGVRPGCGNCAKSHRLCSGYQRQHAFILVQGEDKLNSNSQPENKVLNDDAASGVVMVSRWRIPPRRSSTTNENWQHQSAIRPYLPLQVNPKTVYQNQLISSFVNHYVPFDVINERRPMLRGANWLVLIPDHANIIPCLHNAAVALSTARLGRSHNDSTLVHQSLSFYTRSLQQLRRVVEGTYNYEQVITTSMALGLYEYIECPSGRTSGYIAHHMGVMKLVQTRGPCAHRSGLAHSILQNVRMHSFFQGLRERSPSFLAKREWLELPWSFTKKTYYDELMDCLIQMPNLFALLDARKAAKDFQEKAELILQELNECLRLNSEVAKWHSRFEKLVAGPLYRPQLSTMMNEVDSSEEGNVFPVAFHFVNFFIAQVSVLYWVGLTILNERLISIYSVLPQIISACEKKPCSCVKKDGVAEMEVVPTCLHHFDPSDVPPLGKRSEWPQTTARYVCQSVEYFLRAETHGVGPATIVPNLMVVKRYWMGFYGIGSREVQWIDTVVLGIQRRSHKMVGQLI